MNVEYINDLSKNYMTVSYEGNPEALSAIMITENVIPGALNCRFRYMNGKTMLYYDISSLQNMETLYQNKKLPELQFRSLIESLNNLVEELPDYFLPQKTIQLSPEYIFWCFEQQKFLFMIYPQEEQGPDCLDAVKLSEFLVTVVNHEEDSFCHEIYQFYEDANQYHLHLEKYMSVMEGNDELKSIPFMNKTKSQTTTEEKSTAQEESFLTIRQEDNRYEEELHSDDTTSDNTAYDDMKEESELSNQVRRISQSVILLLLFFAFIVVLGMYLYHRTQQVRMITYCALTASIGTAFFLICQIYSNRKRDERVKARVFQKNKVAIVMDHGESDYTDNDYAAVVADDMLYEYAGEQRRQKAEEELGKTVYVELENCREEKLYGLDNFRKYKISLQQLPITIGKDANHCEFVIPEKAISRIHARFLLEENRLVLMDLNSTNGTYHNGIKLRPNQKVVIEEEDEIAFGNIEFVYR